MTSQIGLVALFTALVAGTTACTARGAPQHVASPSMSTLPTVSAPPLPLPHGVLADISVGGGPLRMAAGFGSLWVASHRAASLVRIDPSTNRVLATIRTGTESCGEPAIGLARVWISGCGPGPLVAVDPKTNKVVARANYESSLVMAVADGKIWAGDPLDPATLHPTAHIHADAGDVVAGARSIWFMEETLVKRVDPGTGQVTHTYRAGDAGALENFGVFAAGALWVYSGGNHIWRIDPRRNTVTMHVLHGIDRDANATFAVGDGAVWVRPYAGLLYRFDLTNLTTRRKYSADTRASGFVTVAFGSIWESNLEEDSVWRLRE